MSERAAQARKPVDSSPRHFLDLCDFEPGTLKALIAAARQRKKARNGLSRGAEDKDAPLTGKVLNAHFREALDPDAHLLRRRHAGAPVAAVSC